MIKQSGNAFDDKENVKKIKKLRDDGDTAGLMNFFYELVEDNPGDIFTSVNTDEESKVKALESALRFFSDNEEYEKCARIQKVVSAFEKRGD